MNSAYVNVRLAILFIMVVCYTNFGCVASIESVFSDSDLVDVPELVGKWTGQKEQDSTLPRIEDNFEEVSVKRLTKGVYSVEGAGLGGKEALLHVFKHGDSIYAEIQQLPESQNEQLKELFAPSVIRPRWILKLEIDKQRCVVYMMNSAALKRNLQKKSNGLHFVSIGVLTGYEVLTGDPKEIRSAIEAAGDKCFQNGLSFKRGSALGRTKNKTCYPPWQ